MATLKNTKIQDTGYLQFPTGSEAQRPNSPEGGYIRFNTDTNKFEMYDGTEWRIIEFKANEIVTEGITIHLDSTNTNSYSGTGNQWNDLSGNDYHAINVGATFNTSPKHFSFDGSNDYMYLKSINYGNTNLDEISMFVWMRTSFGGGAYNDNWAFLDFDRSETFTFYIHGSSGKTAFSGKDGINDNFDIEGNTSFNDGEWHYLGVTYSKNDGKIKMYADGSLDKEFTYTLGSIGSGGVNRYGFIGDGSEADSENGSRNEVHFDGDIGMLHFYENKVLTPTEILQNYDVTKEYYI